MKKAKYLQHQRVPEKGRERDSEGSEREEQVVVEEEMDWNGGFGRIKGERKNLSFYKIFQSSDLSSESMRALPYSFMQNLSDSDFSYKMVIRAQWGSSWEVNISKNPKLYYMEKSGWNQFVSDNALGENEFVTFTHTGLMRFNVNIYKPSGKEIVTPQKPPPTTPFSEVKKEGESSYKDVKREEEACDSVERVEIEATKKKAEPSKTSKKSKKVVREVGESSRGRKKKAEKLKTFKKKKKKIKKGKKGVPEFEITIRKSYLKFLLLPRVFEEEHMPSESLEYTIHNLKRKSSWNVLCLVRENRTVFSSGWSRLAREFPLKVGDRCTFKLIKPTEFILITKKARKESTVVD